MIGILNYGMGNLGSIRNMLARLSRRAEIIQTVAELDACERLILPGVGAFDTGMRNLEQSGFRDALEAFARSGKPILGICLGMQLLASKSDEGHLPGLGWINAEVRRITRPAENQEFQQLKIPHMGWNIATAKIDSRLFRDLPPDPRFYFVHSYHVVCASDHDVSATIQYGSTLTAAIESKNIFGVQFHPEKSHKFGMKVLENFAQC
jgi:glutamine amidotransferase